MSGPSSVRADRAGRIGALLTFAALVLPGACKPAAADRVHGDGQAAARANAPGEPLASPDTTGAVWAPAAPGARLLYGVPGAAPLVTLACEPGPAGPQLTLVRIAPADPHAQAFAALVGKRHAAHLPVDAKWTGKAWLWEGHYPAADERLDGLIDQGELELTVPGAGSVVLNPSELPGLLLAHCRGTEPATDQADRPQDR